MNRAWSAALLANSGAVNMVATTAVINVLCVLLRAMHALHRAS
jgi:hypothetical protein